MRTLEVDGLFPHFRYKIQFVQETTGWFIHNVQLIYRGAPIFPRRRVSHAFASENAMIDHALAWCDTIARHLMLGEAPQVDLPAHWTIPQDQLDRIAQDSATDAAA